MAKQKRFDITAPDVHYQPCPHCGATEGMGLIQRQRCLHVACIVCGILGPGVPNRRPCWQNEKKAFDYWNVLPRSLAKAPPPLLRGRTRRHEFRLDHRQEFDEIVLPQASVHIERMDETAFWIGIEAIGLPGLMVNTGVNRGTWYFNIEEDEHNGRSFTVHRPRSRTPRIRKTEK
jgi:hypothetical protein